jgi:ABC-type sugar transport system permease subunit
MSNVTSRRTTKTMVFTIRIALLSAIKREIIKAGRIKGAGRATSFRYLEDTSQPAIG